MLPVLMMKFEWHYSMSPWKAPGEDGLHAGFYQTQWNLVGPAICGQVH